MKGRRMTFNEFKAWLEGYEESFSYEGAIQAPNAFQYGKLKKN